MKLLIIILLMGLLAGCSSTRQTIYSDVPHLLIQYPLPDVSSKIYKSNFSVSMLIYISKDGNVEDVKILGSSGDRNWDSLAIKAILNWKYSPAKIKNEPVPAWIRQTAFLEFRNPVFMHLGEILCKNKDEADTVYSALREGADFGILAEKFSAALSAKDSGNIGTVNINQYPEDIRKFISPLEIDDFTVPIVFGDNYIIIKRYKDTDISDNK